MRKENREKVCFSFYSLCVCVCYLDINQALFPPGRFLSQPRMRWVEEFKEFLLVTLIFFYATYWMKTTYSYRYNYYEQTSFNINDLISALFTSAKTFLHLLPKNRKKKNFFLLDPSTSHLATCCCCSLTHLLLFGFRECQYNCSRRWGNLKLHSLSICTFTLLQFSNCNWPNIKLPREDKWCLANLLCNALAAPPPIKATHKRRGSPKCNGKRLGVMTTWGTVKRNVYILFYFGPLFTNTQEYKKLYIGNISI